MNICVYLASPHSALIQIDLTRTSWIFFCKHSRTQSIIIIKDPMRSHPAPLCVQSLASSLSRLLFSLLIFSLLIKQTHTHLLTNPVILNIAIKEHCVPHLSVDMYTPTSSQINTFFFSELFLTLLYSGALCCSPLSVSHHRSWITEGEGGQW